MARREAPRISERECGHIKNNGCATWRAIPSSLRGNKGKTGLPGASPNNTGDDACLFARLGCLKIEYDALGVMAGLVPAIHVLRYRRQTWMPATSAGMTVERRKRTIGA